MAQDGQDSRVLVLVAGAGRSGTSTVAGALHRLGFHVPGPEVPPDDTNPRGFYEPQWVVDTHKRILDGIPVRTNDARPLAVGLTREAAADPALREQVTDWLREADDGHDRIVIKDPRSFWFHDLWDQVAAATQREMRVLTMLRHPTEVAGSRATHYLTTHSEEDRRARETTNVAGWTFGTLVTERLSRRGPRTFVRYDELRSDWRAALGRADTQLDLGVAGRIAEGGDPPIDDFIDAGLHRVRTTWADTDVPHPLRELAEGVWESVNRLVESPDDHQAQDALDRLYEDYVAQFQYALDLTLDQRKIENRYARQDAREKQRQRSEDLRRRLTRQRAVNDALRRENEQLRSRLRYEPRALAGRALRKLRRA